MDVVASAVDSGRRAPVGGSAPLPVAPAPAPTDSVSLGSGSAKPVVVAVGDSLTAGMQDGMYSADRQRAGYVALLAGAAGVPMNLPLITDGTIPPGYWTGSVFDSRYVDQLQQAMVHQIGPLAAYLEYVGMPKDLSAVWTLPGMGHRDPATVDSAQRPQGNFAVAGFELRHLNDVHNMWDYVQELRDFVDEKTGLVMELPGAREILQNGTDQGRGSEIDQAIQKNPDLVLFWGGANDALAPAFDGVIDDRTLTPVADQIWNFWHKDLLTNQWMQRQSSHEMKGFYHSLLGPDGGLTRLLKGTHAEVVVMNLPDISAIPFLRDVGQPVGRLPFRIILKDGTDATEQLERYVIPERVLGPGKDGRTEYPPGTKVGILNLLGKIVATSPGGVIENADQMRAAMAKASRDGAFDEWEVLDPEEVTRVNGRIDEFNQIIALAAQNPRVHLVDMHQLMEDLKDQGRTLRGSGAPVRVTTTFTGAPRPDGTEGIFSFDGVHPSNTGHALIANVVLDRIKQDLGNRDKFRCFRDALPVDERAAYRGDPHRGDRPALLLTPAALNMLAPEAHRSFVAPPPPPSNIPVMQQR